MHRTVELSGICRITVHVLAVIIAKQHERTHVAGRGPDLYRTGGRHLGIDAQGEAHARFCQEHTIVCGQFSARHLNGHVGPHVHNAVLVRIGTQTKCTIITCVRILCTAVIHVDKLRGVKACPIVKAHIRQENATGIHHGADPAVIDVRVTQIACAVAHVQSHDTRACHIHPRIGSTVRCIVEVTNLIEFLNKGVSVAVLIGTYVCTAAVLEACRGIGKINSAFGAPNGIEIRNAVLRCLTNVKVSPHLHHTVTVTGHKGFAGVLKTTARSLEKTYAAISDPAAVIAHGKKISICIKPGIGYPQATVGAIHLPANAAAQHVHVTVNGLNVTHHKGAVLHVHVPFGIDVLCYGGAMRNDNVAVRIDITAHVSVAVMIRQCGSVGIGNGTPNRHVAVRLDVARNKSAARQCDVALRINVLCLRLSERRAIHTAHTDIVGGGKIGMQRLAGIGYGNFTF